MPEQDVQTKFSLSALLIVSAAAPIWLYLIVVIPRSPGFGGGPSRFLAAPIVLTGISLALHRLLRRRTNALPIAALLSPIIALGALLVAFWLVA